MENNLKSINTLKRPRLMVSAARIAAAAFQRDRDLRKLLGKSILPNPKLTTQHLILMENAMEDARRERQYGYNITRHVTVLAALLAEMRLLKQA